MSVLRMSRRAIHSGMQKLDYTRIHVPVLAFYALPAALEDQILQYAPKTADERTVMEQVYRAEAGIPRTASSALKAGVPSARIVELPGANHYIFLSNEARVLSELRAFLATIRDQ